ncbi:peptidase domain-containing ABC transporter [Oscillatoriales cyanobacterium LEGE 11467]|uniref:Peptidase domain-containing ABC transporter n=1 Tax=Zarconia navalis LEGE 11467 TaxID=1828826 RepID=A0A928W253_9CYAN|nr:peptidase domain-containing ABC transporter [Zarconia navalis]MBE9042538.1 peptidase domain-containing ABC transporter [Zarconia navalis LEGE 11467]
MKSKYAVFLQHSETDCGAACLGAIAKHYGQTLTLNKIREMVGTGQQGTTLLGLQRGAEALGFNARSVRAAPAVLDRLSEAPLPAIIHWKGYHWVVLHGKDKKGYAIADPAVGLRHVSKAELKESWTDWILLLLEPDPARFSTRSTEDVKGWERFWRPVLQYRGLLSQVLLFNLAVGLLSVATPFLIQFLTDDVLVRGDLNLLNAMILGVVVMTVFASGLQLVQSNLTAHFSQRLELGLMLQFGRKLLRLPLTYYETRRSGEIVSRLRDIQQINQFLAQIVVGLPSQVFIALVSWAVMAFYSMPLTLAATLLSALMSLSTVFFLPTLQRQTRNLLVLDAETQGVLVETFKGAMTLKTTTAGPQFWEELQGRFGRLGNLAFRTNQIGFVNNIFSGFISATGNALLLWFGSYLVINTGLSIGQLLAFITLNGNVATLIRALIGFVDEFTRVKTAVVRLTEVIDHQAESNEKTPKPMVTLAGDAQISCHNVTFHYPGKVDLLDRFSLTLQGGQTIALIGVSGCGKSTLAKLLAGLYPVESGNIQIGGYNLADLDLNCLRQQAILVPQDAHFWSRSIIENFRLGNPNIEFDAIVKACQITGADEFIAGLPDRYQTILGEFGANLSGGQRQRLAIARAIVDRPPMLILDESTSGLDPRSEAEVLDRLLHHRRGMTTLLISHRPRVINRADWIVVLDRGQLVLQGSPETLRSKPGPHQDLLIP